MSRDPTRGRGMGPNRPDFLDDDEALFRRLDEIIEVDPETNVEYFKGTRVETSRPKKYRNAGRTREEFLADHPAIPKDWVDDSELMDAQRFTAEWLIIERAPGGEDRPFVIRGRLEGIMNNARDLSRTGGSPVWEEDVVLRRSWEHSMEEFRRLRDKLAREELEEEAVKLYHEAVVELRRALPVIRRLGLVEPPVPPT